MKTVSLALCGASLVLVPVAASGAPSGKTWQLSKVVLDTETNEVSARVKGGTLCVFPSNVKIPKEKKTQDYERFDNLFTQKMKEAGFTVVSTSGDMFSSDDDKNKADYLVGVTLRPTVINLCSSIKGEKGDMAITAEWQIYDRAAKRIVQTASTSAQGIQAKFASDGMNQMINGAFTANLAALLQKGVEPKPTTDAPAQ